VRVVSWPYQGWSADILTLLYWQSYETAVILIADKFRNGNTLCLL
jgi:hypothetical protein